MRVSLQATRRYGENTTNLFSCERKPDAIYYYSCTNNRMIDADLKKHVRVVHHNERKFICQTCKKCFGERGYVRLSVAQFSDPFLTRRNFSVARCTLLLLLLLAYWYLLLFSWFFTFLKGMLLLFCVCDFSTPTFNSMLTIYSLCLLHHFHTESKQAHPICTQEASTIQL